MKKNMHGLGRGLGALIREDDNSALFTSGKAVNQPEDIVQELPLTAIDPNPEQARKHFDEAALAELSASIKEIGVIQPIVVYPVENRYVIIAGERRFRAARLAELEKIPAIVRTWDENMRMAASLVENLQRNDLNPIEEANGILALMERFGLTQEQVSKRLGKSRPAVANSTRLLHLPEEIQAMLREGKLSAGHGRVLLAVESEERQVQLANMAIQQAWSVRRLEQVVALEEAQPAKKPKQPKQPELTSLETMAREVFGTKVKLQGDMKKGKLVLNYYNAEDLQRIWDVIERLKPED